MSSTRPGVEVTQVFTTTSSTATAATLVPAIVGVCKQIVEIRDSNGSLSADALYGTESYQQSSMLIPQASFPDSRGIIDEVEVEEDSIQAALRFWPRLTELSRGSHSSYGQAFLKGMNIATRAAFRSGEYGDYTFASPTTLQIALDLVAGAPRTSVTLSGTMTAAEVAEAINAAVGTDVASVYEDDGDEYLQIVSEAYGASSSIELGGTDALRVLFDITPSATSYRVEGSGFRGQDDLDGDLVTPWIEFHRGTYFESGIEQSGFVSWAGRVGADDVFVSGPAEDVTFTGANATVPLVAATAIKPGDQLWGDGAQVQSAEITKVEPRRFRLGTLNATLSTYGDDGVPTNRVYSPVEVGTPSATVPFAPVSAYFRADGLRIGEVSPVGVAATLAGDTAGLDARPAILAGTSELAYPLMLAGLTFTYTLTEDGVAHEQVAYTFPGGTICNSAADLLTAVETAVSGGGVDVDVVNNTLVLRTAKTGAGQALTLHADNVVAANIGLGFDGAASDAGKDVEFAAPAVLTGTTVVVADLPFAALDGAEVSFAVSDSKGQHEIAFTLDATAAGLTTLASLATHLNAKLALAYPYEVATFGVSGDALTITSVEGGSAVSLDVVAADASDALFQLGFDDGSVTMGPANTTASGTDLLDGTALSFYLDGSAEAYEVTFTSNSLAEAVDAINVVVNGATDVAVADEGTLVLTSLLAGAASAIEIDGDSTAASVFGLSGVAEGSGRPNPDFYVDEDGAVVLGPNILRDWRTGVPVGRSSVRASVYMAYKGIRKDVTASAAAPGLLTFSSLSEMEAAIGPISVENPLALGCYLAFQAAATVQVSALGVDEANAAAPYGTLDGWSRALEYLEQKEVYTVVPLTSDTYVHGLVAEHVAAMSAPENRGERITFAAPEVPTRAPATTIVSGAGGQSTGFTNVFLLDTNPSADLAAAGLPTGAVGYDKHLYLEVLVVNGGASDLRRYSVSNVNDSALTLRTTFTGTQNEDGFFTTTPLTETLSELDYTLAVRGAALLVPGTTRKNLTAIAAAAAQEGEAYGTRRVHLLFGSAVDVSVDGVIQQVPMFYAGAVIAGMVAQQLPRQPFTNVAVPGLGRVYGTDDTFSDALLDTIADGGRYLLVNSGGRVVCRHQRSTDSSSIETRELSITKAIDWLAKTLRQANRNFIGRYVITPNFLDQLTLANESVLSLAEQVAVNTADLTEVAQSEDAPDTVLLEVEVQPSYPCNKIRITIIT